MRLVIAAMIVLIGLGSAGPAGAGHKEAVAARTAARQDAVDAIVVSVGGRAFKAGDYMTAVREWRPLAEQGNKYAQNLLGGMYNEGEGINQDYEEAVKWFRKSAEQGLAQAQFGLGFMYAQGRGVLEDDKEAVTWYFKSAAQGYVNAQYNLGVMHDQGRGVIQDWVLAHMWYNIVGANGDKVGAANREKIEKLMTSTQIAEAQKLARECMAKKYKGCGR